MKKHVAFVLCPLLAAGLLVGCRAEKSASVAEAFLSEVSQTARYAAGSFSAVGHTRVLSAVNAIQLHVPVRIINQTDTSFYGFYCSAANAENWGENILGNAVWDKGITLSTGFYTDDTEPCFDFMLIDKNEIAYSVKNVQLTCSGSEDIVLLLTGNAEAGLSISVQP